MAVLVVDDVDGGNNLKSNVDSMMRNVERVLSESSQIRVLEMHDFHPHLQS